MSEFDKWEIAVVLPRHYEDFGLWVIQKTSTVTNLKSGIIYHKHPISNSAQIRLYMIDSNGCCRYCGASCPVGVIFRAKTHTLDDVGVN